MQADSQGHVLHYHELMSRVWPVNAYFFQDMKIVYRDTLGPRHSVHLNRFISATLHVDMSLKMAAKLGNCRKLGKFTEL